MSDTPQTLPLPPSSHLDYTSSFDDTSFNDSDNTAVNSAANMLDNNRRSQSPIQRMLYQHNSVVTETRQGLQKLLVFGFCFSFTSTLRLSVIILYSRQFDNFSRSWIAFSVFVSFLLAGLESLFLNYLSTRYHKYGLLLTISTILDAFAFYVEAMTPSFTVLAAIYSVSGRPMLALSNSMIVHFLPRHEAARLLKQMIQVSSVGAILGPFVAGIIIHYVSFRLAFFVCAAMASALFLFCFCNIPVFEAKIRSKQLAMLPYYSPSPLLAPVSTNAQKREKREKRFKNGKQAIEAKNKKINENNAKIDTKNVNNANNKNNAKITNEANGEISGVRGDSVDSIASDLSGDGALNSLMKIEDVLGRDFMFPVCMHAAGLQGVSDLAAFASDAVAQIEDDTIEIDKIDKIDNKNDKNIQNDENNNKTEESELMGEHPKLEGYGSLEAKLEKVVLKHSKTNIYDQIILWIALFSDGACFGAQSAMLTWLTVYLKDECKSGMIVACAAVSVLCLSFACGIECARVLVIWQKNSLDKAFHYRRVNDDNKGVNDGVKHVMRFGLDNGVSLMLLTCLLSVSVLDLFVVPEVNVSDALFVGMYAIYVVVNGFVLGSAYFGFETIINVLRANVNVTDVSYGYASVSLNLAGNRTKLLIRCVWQACSVVVIGIFWDISEACLWVVAGYCTMCAWVLVVVVVVVETCLR